MSDYTFEQFSAIRRYQPSLTLSRDGSDVAYITNTSGQFNLWRQSTAGGYPRQLTLFENRAVRDVAWSPDGSTIAFTADRDGNEFKQIFTIPARGGRVALLTEAEGVRHEMSGDPWSPDGSQLAYGGNDRSEEDVDVMVRTLATGDVRLPVDYGGYYVPAGWAPDGKTLTVVQFNSNTDLNIFTLSTTDEELVLQTAHEGEIKFEPGPWARDGSGFWLLSDEGREFTGLAFQTTAGERRWVETPNADIEHVDLSGDGTYLVWIVNQSGYSQMMVRNLQTNAMVELPEIPNGVIETVAISHSGGKIAFLLNRPTNPIELMVVDLEAGSVTQLTESGLGGIDPAELITPELITIKAFDGRDIPAWLYRPKVSGRVPVLLSIHGGPEAQERPQYVYSGLYQYLLSQGIAVLAPNIRGSTGYGKSYQKLIHRDFGGNDLKDFRAAAEYLRGLDWIDPERMAVFGGSYGGFATLTCVTRLPEYWKAAVDIVGPSNLVTFAKAVPPTWRRSMTQWVGDPYTEVDFLMERSPITYVDQVKAPLFVIQGANDPRVVKGESDQIVERLRARGVEVKYDVYEDEGHGFTRRANELKAIGDAAEFLISHLQA